ncbi:putative ATP-dependent RNA helicase DDX20 [Paroedura picta]|uniref:putative ATP-dependent RNA helicase DDX20 n=1 Tax=Paroedura picta TaxID=143630 RepID=UPI004056A355
MTAPAEAESWLRTRDVLVPEGPEDFGSLLLSAPVLEGLRAAGFLRPSPVQLKAIPLGRCGLDLIVQAKSGTGKTCVFSTIALDSLILESPVTQILVLAPTREIAVQIHAVITTIGIKMEGLECHVFIGGTPLNQDKTRLKKCHIAVGSPGRIKQLIELNYLNTASIRLFILDEADKLLEQGSFQEQINWIYSSLPANKQMLAVSATYPESLANTLTRYMRDPTFVRLNPTDPSLIGLKQYFKVVNSYPLPHKTFEEKAQHLQELFSKIPFNQALVFSNLHSRAQHLADLLTSKGFPAECISGNMNQNQRLDAMAKLKQFHCRVLISTDLTSRGIDAEKVNLVINLDVPLDWETYMHRIGRAGRFGTLGLAVTYCCRGEEENVLMNIAQKCNLRLLPLPEPVPPELMEQFDNWDVEVTAVPYPNASLHAALPDKQPEKTVQHTAGGSSAKGSCAAASENLPAPKPKQVLRQKQLLKGRAEQSNTKRTLKDQPSSQCTAEPKWQLKPSVQTSEQQYKQEVDKEALRNKLPKIPCLSSYKSHPSTNTWSMAEFVEDYEYFIKEGLEKKVEIIRSYTGPGEQHSENDTLDGKASAWTGESDSDSSTYSSDSLAYSSDGQSPIRASSDIQKGEDGELSADQTFQRHSEHFTVVPEQKKIPEPPVLQKIKQNVKHSKHRRQSYFPPAAKPSKRGGLKGAPQYEPDPPFLCETQSYEEYWKAYYQAYQDYYSTASYPYNYMHSWLTAYRAHAVYIKELLRGHQ